MTATSKNPFVKTLGPPYSKKSGFLGQGIVNSSVTPGNNPRPGKGNMPAGGSMQAQIDAIKRRLDADTSNDAKAEKADPANGPSKNAIVGRQGSGPINQDPNKGSYNTQGNAGSVRGATNRGTPINLRKKNATGDNTLLPDGGNRTNNVRSNGIG